MPGGLQRFRERVLRLDVRVSHLLVEPVRSRSRGTRPQANHRTSLLPGPVLGLRHEHPANSLSAGSFVDHESANYDERFRLDVFKNRRVQPSRRAPLDFGHEQLLFGPRKHALRAVVAALMCATSYPSCAVRRAMSSASDSRAGRIQTAMAITQITSHHPELTRAVVQESLPSLRQRLQVEQAESAPRPRRPMRCACQRCGKQESNDLCGATYAVQHRRDLRLAGRDSPVRLMAEEGEPRRFAVLSAIRARSLWTACGRIRSLSRSCSSSNRRRSSSGRRCSLAKKGLPFVRLSRATRAIRVVRVIRGSRELLVRVVRVIRGSRSVSSVLSVALVARHQRLEIRVAHRDSLLEGAGKWRASRQIFQERDDGRRATLINQAAHGQCRRLRRRFRRRAWRDR